MQATIRLFLPVPANYNPKFRDWSYLSLRFLEAFNKTELPIRCINYAAYPNGSLNDEESPFYKYNHMFVRDLGDIRTNIVLGFGNVFDTYYTQGMYNIGITVSYPRPNRIEEVRALEKYDKIWAGTSKTREDLEQIGLHVDAVASPEPLILGMLMKGLNIDG